LAAYKGDSNGPKPSHISDIEKGEVLNYDQVQQQIDEDLEEEGSILEQASVDQRDPVTNIQNNPEFQEIQDELLQVQREQLETEKRELLKERQRLLEEQQRQIEGQLMDATYYI
jgi:vacuolar-type H+-ATPase subunit H